MLRTKSPYMRVSRFGGYALVDTLYGKGRVAPNLTNPLPQYSSYYLWVVVQLLRHSARLRF